MENKDLLAKIYENKELYLELKKLWNDNATAKEFSVALSKFGIETSIEQIEKTLKSLMKMEGNEIGLQKLDEVQLENINGGGAGVDCTSANDCDDNFIDNYDLDKKYKCYYNEICDEFANMRLL